MPKLKLIKSSPKKRKRFWCWIENSPWLIIDAYSKQEARDIYLLDVAPTDFEVAAKQIKRKKK